MIHDLDEARRERAAFASLIGDSTEPAPEIDADAIWKAVAGELSAEETGRLLDLAAESPEVAEAWRLARELQRADAAAADEKVVRPRRWSARVAVPVGLAAALLLAVGLWPMLRDAPSPEPPAFRTTAEQGVQALTGDGATLPREGFELRWRPLEGDGWRYGLLVTTDALRELLRVGELTETRYVVAPEALDGVDGGSLLYWRIEAVNEDGRRAASQTFFVTLQ